MTTISGKKTGEITEELILELVPDYGRRFLQASKPFFRQIGMGNRYRKTFFHGKDARPLLATLQNRNRLLIQLRVPDRRR